MYYTVVVSSFFSIISAESTCRRYVGGSWAFFYSYIAVAAAVSVGAEQMLNELYRPNSLKGAYIGDI